MVPPTPGPAPTALAGGSYRSGSHITDKETQAQLKSPAPAKAWACDSQGCTQVSPRLRTHEQGHVVVKETVSGLPRGLAQTRPSL